MLFKAPSLEEWGIGCDQDIGGYSQAKIERTGEGTMKWCGKISLAMDPSSDAIYTGYAALRSRTRLPTHAFDDRCLDCSRWSFVVARMKGDHRSYTFNFKPHRAFSGDLYSVPFRFLKPYTWEEVVFPFRWFRRTNCGVQYYRQYPPNLEKVESFGLLLSDHVPGPFSVEIDWIKVTNFDYKYGEVSEWNEEDKQFLTKHLLEKNPRLDFSDSVENNFGFGMDLEGRVESMEQHEKRWKNTMPNRVHNPHWKVEVTGNRPVIRPTPIIMKKTA